MTILFLVDGMLTPWFFGREGRGQAGIAERMAGTIRGEEEEDKRGKEN